MKSMFLFIMAVFFSFNIYPLDYGFIYKGNFDNESIKKGFIESVETESIYDLFHLCEHLDCREIHYDFIFQDQEFKNLLEKKIHDIICTGDFFIFNVMIGFYKEHNIELVFSDGSKIELSNPKLEDSIYQGIVCKIGSGDISDYNLLQINNLIALLDQTNFEEYKNKLLKAFLDGITALAEAKYLEDVCHCHYRDVRYDVNDFETIVALAHKYDIDITLNQIPGIKDSFNKGLIKIINDISCNSFSHFSNTISYLKDNELFFDLFETESIKNSIEDRFIQAIKDYDMEFIRDFGSLLEKNEIDYNISDIEDLTYYCEEGIRRLIKAQYFTTMTYDDEFYYSVTSTHDYSQSFLYWNEGNEIDPDQISIKSCLDELDEFIMWAKQNGADIDLVEIEGIEAAFVKGIVKEIMTRKTLNKLNLALEEGVDINLNTFLEIAENALGKKLISINFDI